ncbi:hypothetical protein MY04_4934 [Flammeovirga sp. MY04]|uniref:baseplate J/gp47 family protein n=1 Tax=Flammeovirga sp. MY04 TaxID=1191459 RepID=UPI00080621B5|nr:baseplate J/gp47 family protein [Flammeovirga sp. MY04]ANQ52269.1 hypothetical protein MY04_4934 [Flammeovirga sp. MY04]
MIYNGTSQDSRELSQLLDKGFLLNDIDLRDILTNTFQYLETLEKKDRDFWYTILFSDFSVLSELKELDISIFQKKNNIIFQKVNQFNRPQKKMKFLIEGIKLVHQLLNFYHKWLKNYHKKQLFDSEIYLNITTTLNSISTQLDLEFLYLFDEEVLNNELAETKLLIKEIFQFIDYSFDEEHISENRDHTVVAKICQRLNIQLIDNLFLMSGKSDKYFKELIGQTTSQPQIDLIMAYQHIYKYPQKMLNSFPQRYLNLYFNTLLDEKRKEEKVDYTYLHFKLNDGVRYARVPNKTKFIAGSDELRKNILYELDYPMVLNTSEITNLDLSNVSYKKIGKKLPLKVLTSIKQSESEIKEGEVLEKNLWDNQATDTLPISFCICDQILQLENGDREIIFNFQFTQVSMDKLTQLISNVKEITGWSGHQLFNNIFSDIFNVHYSSIDGWVKAQKVIFLTSKYSPNSLSFKVVIKANEPAVCKAGPEIQYHELFDQAVFKFTLNTETYLYGYSFLSDLVVDRVVIQTYVKGYTGFNAYNQQGQLGTDIPYQGWGNQPKQGDYLVLGSNEVFFKPIEHFDLKIKWFNEPAHPNGLTGYYENYDTEELRNSNFKLYIDQLKQGKWDHLDERHMFSNVRSNIEGEVEDIGAISKETDLLNIKYQQPVTIDEAQKEDLEGFSNYVKNGYLKLTISSPEIGFGHLMYPQLVTAQVRSRISLNPFKKKKEVEIPLAYVPVIEKIEADYIAKTSIIFENKMMKEDAATKLFYGVGEKIISTKSDSPKLLPEVNAGIVLDLGIDNSVEGDIVSLLFQIKSTTDQDIQSDQHQIIWEVLNNNRWEAIPGANILNDETECLSKTGMISLKVPEHSKENQLKPSGKLWLRMYIPDVMDNYGVIEKVYSKVVKVGLILPEERSYYDFGKELEAQSIFRSNTKLPGIRSIEQPLTSFGGKRAEESGAFINRVSETIKHRNRPVSNWDYERIILTEFHEINQVICIPVSEENRSLLIVIIPKSEKKFPIASNSLLQRVERFLKQIISPHVKFSICSPIYETVKINVAISLKEGYTQGFYLDEINQKLTQFIDTISLSNANRLVLGGKLHLSDILSYLKTIAYVDGIKHLSMVHLIKNERKFKLVDTAQEDYTHSFIEASKPWSVLTSAANHEVYINNKNNDKAGINNLELGIDLIVNSYS